MSLHEDRRDAKSQRIPFEAIVELGGEVDPGSAFEAQGVDVSATGMHLRTAYLPDVGQPLLCRFGSGAQEISAEADVVWRREGARGGEFGIRFTNLDGVSAAALWDMCGMNRGEPGQQMPGARPETDPGTRVRLHIDGLGSPMKARVRGSTDAELLVGSNLEFLRVGRQLELEDVDHGGKRPAHIDRVDVEIDRTSRVPQLVVTLRYDDVSPEAGPVRVAAGQVTRPSAMPDPSASEPSEPAPPAVTSARVTAASLPSAPDTNEEAEAARMMRSKFSSAAADIMPRVAELGARARTTMGLLFSKALERTHRSEAAPRRTTSPPPTGALHASGKRVVREGDDDEYDARPVPKRKIGKKGMVLLGGTAGLVTVIAAMTLHKSSSAPPATATSTAESNAAPAAVTPPSDPGSVAPGALQANVPLFGPTTLSTTELVVAATPPASFGAMGASGPSLRVPGASSSPVEAVDDRRSDDDGDSTKYSKVAPFGHGKVSHATTLRMKTDGDITAIHGARTPTGFTVTLPGRRSMESGPSLAGRDPRIASVHVSNGSKGSELTFQFKDGVPPYLVSARGHDLQIALGRSGEPSDSSTDTAKRGSTAKKGAPETHHRSKRDL